MKKQLFRSNTNKIFGGVAGGLADYFKVDPILFRAAFIILTLAWGGGIFIYIVMWIITPEKSFNHEFIYDHEQNKYVKNESFIENEISNDSFFHKKQSNILLGSILVAIGAFVIFLKIIPDLNLEFVLPVILVIAGIIILIKPVILNSGEKL